MKTRNNTRQNSYLHFNPYSWLGLALLTLFFLQYTLEITPQWLTALQKIDTYKQLSGFLLFAYVCMQWRLAFTNLNKSTSNTSQRNSHKVLGAFAPLLYYFHSMQLGYAYQYLFALAFLGICLTGCLSPSALQLKSTQYYIAWLLTHISLATIVGALLIYHIYIVYIY